MTRDDGKSKGLAFVKFSKKSSFNQALELNGTDHFGRNITVEEAKGKPSNDGGFKKGGNFSKGGDRGGFNKFQNLPPANITTPTLFIGGLSYNSTAESLTGYFSQAGEVARARVVTDRETGKVKIILFSPEDLDTLNSTMSILLKKLMTPSTMECLTEDKLGSTVLLRDLPDLKEVRVVTEVKVVSVATELLATLETQQ